MKKNSLYIGLGGIGAKDYKEFIDEIMTEPKKPAGLIIETLSADDMPSAVPDKTTSEETADE